MQETRFARQTTSDLKRVIHRCGWATLLALGLLVPLSYGIAAVSPFGLRQATKIAAFHRVIAQAAIPWPGVVGWLNRYLAGDSLLASRAVCALAYGLPLAVATGGFLWVAVTLVSSQAVVDESVVSLLCRMAVAFAAVNVLLYPMFTQDLWFYVAWGRMVAAGQDPYYEFFTADALAGLPVHYVPYRMNYGPLWAGLSGGLSALAGHNVLLEFVIFKLALASLWVLSLALIRRTLAGSSAGDRALAICLFGWLPISYSGSIGEAHNDVAMIFFLLLWMHLALRRHMLSPAAITASVLCKYATLPLAALELLNAWLVRGLPLRRYAVGLLCSALLATLGFAVFWRGGDFFTGLAETIVGDLFTAAHAISSIAGKLHIPVSPTAAANVMRTVFAGIILYYVWRYIREPGLPEFAELTLAVLCGMLFAGVRHMWPWYLIWVVAPAAVAVHSRLLRLVVPAALLGPFLFFYWICASGWGKVHYASVAFCALVVTAMVLLPRAITGTQTRVARTARAVTDRDL